MPDTYATAKNINPAPAPQSKIHIQDYRCRNCGRLLFRAHIPEAAGPLMIEARCPHCGRTLVVEGAQSQSDTLT